MSGCTQDWNGQPGVPGGRLESEQAVREGVAQAYSATAVNQGQASMFITEFGASVVPGHSSVGRPGAMGDPDTTSDASDG